MFVFPAHAKINLTLDILGKRPDGYHEIAGIFQTIDLADELSFEEWPELRLECDVRSLRTEDNLVMKAARLLRKRCASRGALIRLRKRIPLASGLGGGSSDAAATLKGLAQLWALDLPEQEVAEMARQLGSDVPFFLEGGTALVTGRGETITMLPPVADCSVVLLKPPFDIQEKTRRLYGALDAADFTNGERTTKLKKLIQERREINDELLGNCFEVKASLVFSGLEKYKDAFLSAGASSVHLTGAGPTLYSVFSAHSAAESVHHKLISAGMDAYLSKTAQTKEVCL